MTKDKLPERVALSLVKPSLVGTAFHLHDTQRLEDAVLAIKAPDGTTLEVNVKWRRPRLVLITGNKRHVFS
jgi:hypothetical protein